MRCLSRLQKTEIPHFRRVAGLIAVTALAACSDDPIAPDPPRAVALAVTPEWVVLTTPREMAAFTAIIKDQYGAAFSGTVSWSSSEPDVFTVGPSGVVTAVASGSGSVTATFENLTVTAAVTVALEHSDRAVLKALYRAADGPNWTNNSNWMTDSELGLWYGVGVDDKERVEELRLFANNLTGKIPAELGELTSLEYLDLSANNLTGPLPAEFSGLSDLHALILTNNEGMSGALPAELTRLNLTALHLGGTGLCAPRDERFRAWLDRIQRHRVGYCRTDHDQVAVHLTQAVQSSAFPVPLVAGEPALLRVFMTAKDAGNLPIPPVRATFYSGGRTHVAEIPAGTSTIPVKVDEGNLSASANAEIPASVIAPGAEMVVEIDPDGTLDPSLGIPGRIPEAGRVEVDVHTMPVLDLTLVPFIWEDEPADSSIVKETNALTPEDPMLHPTRTLLPVGDFELRARGPLWTSHEPTFRSGFALLRELELLRTAEGATGYYMGVLRGGGGMAKLEGYVSVSGLQANVIAHELGHNLSLLHAPCGGPAATDPGFPYPGGTIGVWGYDFQADSLVSPSTPDLMSYCGPPDWVSDYHFTNALRYRLNNAGGQAVQAPERVLLLWGGTDADDRPFLEPAFVTNAPPSLPAGGGSHRIIGRNGAGDVLFSVNFDMHEIVDGDGGASFVFGLPARPEWAGALASITLAGPGGSAILDGNSDRTAALVRDTVTGRVRGIFRDWSATAAQAGSGLAAMLREPNLEIQVSRGIPDASAWQR